MKRPVVARDMTQKQKKFVEAYMVDLNATQAAIRAGYSVEVSPEEEKGGEGQ